MLQPDPADKGREDVPVLATSHLAQALALLHAGELDAAECLGAEALRANPGDADALHLVGIVRLRQGRPVEALDPVAAALRAEPRSTAFLCTHGQVLAALGRHEEALESYGKSLDLAPDPAGTIAALHQRARSLAALGRTQAAISDLDRLLAIAPAHAVALNDRGLALRRLQRPAEALASYELAIAAQPGFAEALNNRGVTLLDLGRPQEALASVIAAQAARPDYADARRNEGLIRLMLGDFAAGWPKYEWRWKSRSDWPPMQLPVWDGHSELAGKTLLLHAEQGFGDTVQFVRYVAALASRGARVVLGVPPALKTLLARVDGVAAVVSQGDPMPPVDLQYPMASLPLAFATDLDTIPLNIPYLSVRDEETSRWCERLPQGRPRVGLVWSGSRTHTNDHNRSLRLRQLAPLLQLLQHAGMTFVGLQQDIREIDLADLRGWPAALALGREFRDFTDTAAIVSLLDLVVCVDTSVAHLAGALGRPVWVLLPFVPDWRWLLDRDDSPWYPTARLFRQPRLGDWDSVVARLCAELTRFARPAA
ncbi:MAG TPA: tetratricopeptide repeat-containing glycosyltransferase family protein [Xanthobacteraceae bacterium]|nr:tetratricopeptide repeat-containing glycosyltransferase family protein [Xanthobacteraceae bacterium]